MDSESEKYLPTHVLMNVFCRLGVKSLVRCTCVCKTWLHTINTTSFASTHLTYQKSSSTANKYVLHQDSRSCTLLTHFDPLSYGTKISKLYYTPELFEKDIDVCDGCSLKIHGICDGLLCISNNGISDEYITYFKLEYRVGDNLYLWNPICRKAKKLPELRISEEYDGFVRKGGVSFGHYNNDYKVIVVSTVGDFYDVSVYSLSNNCWNIIHTNCYYEDSNIVDFCTTREYTKFVDGIAYMITDTFRYAPSCDNIPPLAVCFDLKAETIQQIKCPEEFFQYRTKFTMEAYGETVAVLGCDDEFGYLDMWILFRDKSRSCWEKKLVFKLQEVGFSLPVGFLDDGKYLVRTTIYLEYHVGPTYFFLYNLESPEVTEYRCPKDYTINHRCIIDSDCIESLFLLNEDSVHPFVHKDMESSCNSMLFTLHNYLQKTSPSHLQKLIKSYLELTGDDIAVKFASGLANVASLSVSISYPSIAAAPCMFDNAYRNVLALSLATDYTYKEAEKVKEFLKDASRFASSGGQDAPVK